MNILFFVVHPSKFHMINPVVRRLRMDGQHCDIAIISKDVLPELLAKSGLEYDNIFKDDRRCKSRNRLIRCFSVVLNAVRTVYRLWRYVRNKRVKYDLFVTDDCLSVLGWLLCVPTLFLLDDDIDVVREVTPLICCAKRVFAPSVTRLGRFSKKKIPYRGYKEACYLMPSRFQPRNEILKKYGLEARGYAFIRLVSLLATHDRGKAGIADENLDRLIKVLLAHNVRPLLCAERSVAKCYERYAFQGDPQDALDLLAQAAIYFGDSQTMTSEAVLLGVPAIRCNDFVGRISVMEEKESVYDMTYGFLSKDFDKAVDKLDALLDVPDLSERWQRKRSVLLASIEDVSERLLEVIQNREYA